MATKDNGSGFLSKVAKFVRHPTKDWSELDQIGVEPESEPEQDKGYSKQVLKEMIERKRRNDFVRGREFDQLRKLRRNIPVVSSDANARPSFFLASTNASHLEERASTIKKIDDIEAQMSKQWWKGKQEAAGHGEAVSKPPAKLAPDTEKLPTTLPPGAESEFLPTQPPGSDAGPVQGQGRAYAPTQPLNLSRPQVVAEPATEPMLEFGNFGNTPAPVSAKEFSLSGLFSIDLGDSTVDPDMEEAAIRFANRDDAGAEAGLLATLRSDKVRAQSVKGCATALFDLYRATGQQNSFDRLVMECAQRFGQTAPPWFSTPGLLASEAQTAAPSGPVGPVLWCSPAELTLPALQALQTALPQSPQPWHLDWRALRVITPPAAAALAELFAQWCTQPVQLQFSGAHALEQVLRSATPAGDRQVAMFWWHLRLDALRIMGLQDEFELAGLDFCVIHEASPPPWETTLCSYARVPVASSPSGSDDVLTQPGGLAATQPAVLELRGEVIGDASEALGKLHAGPQGVKQLVISCDRLIRVDFAAAGSILNWVMARAAQGCQVQFCDVPYLVAAFFNIIGISEHAKVSLRNN